MLTARNLVDFVLNEKVNQGDEGTKEQTGQNLAIFDRLGIRWA